MKSFTSAVEDVINEDEREAKIVEVIETSKSERAAVIDRLVGEGKSRGEAEAEAPPVLTREDAEAEVDLGKPIEFELDGRTLHAYRPTEGQLAFMLAALGRGQTSDSRTAAIINVMMESLRDDDKDWFEARLLTKDPKKRLGVKTIEAVFEYLTEEWFARPTQ